MKKYSTLEVKQLSVSVDCNILTGSVVEKPIKINNVSVEEYQPGFEEGFVEINFE